MPRNAPPAIAPALVPLAALHPAPWNPRSIKDVRFKNLCDSIQADPDFLWQRPILADAAGEIFAGNMRFRAVAHLGWREVPAIVSDVPARLAKERAMRDNNQWGDLVEQDLAELLVGLQMDGSDLKLLGFPDDELTRLLDSVGMLGTSTDPAPEPDIDHAAELQAKWQTTAGQLWMVASRTVPGGLHRLLCGDSTDSPTVAGLMDGTRAVAAITDPPYNVDVEYGDESSDSKTLDEYRAFTAAWFGLAQRHSDQVLLTPGTGRGLGMPNLRLWFEMQPPSWILAWVKPNSMVRSSLGGFNAWEPIFYYGKPTKKIGQDIYNIPLTVQQAVAAEDGSKLHPTPKQVTLWAAMIEDFTEQGDTLYEPFSGSGTALVAAEQTGRLCYGLEVEPKYVAVALQRLADLGLTPRRVEAGA